MGDGHRPEVQTYVSQRRLRAELATTAACSIACPDWHGIGTLKVKVLVPMALNTELIDIYSGFRVDGTNPYMILYVF